MRTTAIVNQKGGSGKTTTAINLAAICARRGMRTVLIDMDPQSHCAVGLGVPEKSLDMTMAEALIATHDDTFDADALLWEVNRNLSLAPSTIRLATLEAPGGGLHERDDKDRRLESLLQCLSSRFDRCFIDCPPTIGLLTFNALRASREAIIPVETGFFALRGAEKQWQTIQRLIAHINQPIACHLLPTLHDPNSKNARDILAALRRDFAGQIVPVVIEVSEAMREAASFGQPIIEYAPNDKATAQYEEFVEWLEDHLVEPVPEIEVLGHGDDETGIHALRRDDDDRGGSARAAELVRRVNSLAKRTEERIALRENAESIEASTPASVSTAPTPTSTAGPTGMPASVTAPTAAPMASPRPQPRPTPQSVIPPTAPVQTPPTSVMTPVTPLVITTPRTEAPAVAPQPTHRAMLGVTATAHGVVFVQPMSVGQTVAIAGDFNQWSPTATFMTLNREVGVFEAHLPLAPGRYEYRLVVDGVWGVDRFNPLARPNPHGDFNNILNVPSGLVAEQP
ncbi:MAG: AAA family ATPase [Planctomycetota bacterium]